MTTATASIPSTATIETRPSLEALVDRLVESIFGSTDDEPGPEPRAERPRRAPAAAGGRPRRGPGAPRRRRHRDGGTAPGTLGVRRVARPRTAALPPTAGRSYTAPTPDGRRCSPPEATARRWRCWRSSGCAGDPARPFRGAAWGGSGPWREAPRDGGGQHRPGRPRRPQAPPPPRRGRGDDGRRASWQGACPPGRLPLPRGARGQLHGVRRHRALVLLRLRRGRRRAGLPPAARCRPTDRCGQRVARLRVGANEEAIEEFSAILELVPDDTRALFARAVARQWVGRDDAANEDFDRYFEFATDEAAADPAGDARAGMPTRLGKNASLVRPDLVPVVDGDNLIADVALPQRYRLEPLLLTTAQTWHDDALVRRGMRPVLRVAPFESGSGGW